MERNVHGTKSPPMVRNVYGTNSLWYEKSGNPKNHAKDADLSFSMHVKNIVAKAHQRANAIHRCFISRNTNLLVRAYLTFVRPLLEYNSIIWSPHFKCDVDAIEKVQRRFTGVPSAFRA